MRCSLGVPIFLVLSHLPLHAQEQANSPRLWLEIGQSLVCDTPRHSAICWSSRRRNGGFHSLQTVNNESRASTACDIALVPFTDRKLIAARVIQGGFAAIVQIMVHAVGNGETWRLMTAHAGYTIEVEEGQII
jgi:hypothetical protein